MLDFGVQGLTFWLRHPASGPGSNINATYALGLPSEDAANTTELLLTRPVVFLHGVGWGLVRHPIYHFICLSFVLENSPLSWLCVHIWLMTQAALSLHLHCLSSMVSCNLNYCTASAQFKLATGMMFKLRVQFVFDSRVCDMKL